MQKRTLLALAIVCGMMSRGTHAAPTNDGMYADMETSMGTIGLELYFTNAPRTVANFISLSEGTRSWVNFLRGGVSSNNFYKNITFHRVVTNFMIQAGSPNGLGTDGPGYFFNDEFDPALTHVVGSLSMANQGPNSNSSQFFITVVPTPWLDNNHTIFGKVINGMNVVSNINVVPADGSDKPLTDVTITNIVVTRNGTLANAFSVTNVTPQLPRVRAKASTITQSGTNLIMRWTQSPSCQYWILGNTSTMAPTSWFKLTSWSGTASNLNVTPVAQVYDEFYFTTIEVEY